MRSLKDPQVEFSSQSSRGSCGPRGQGDGRDDLDGLGDDRLLVLSQAGDRGAFDRVVRGNFRVLYALLFRFLCNHEDAEDLTQECFVRAWKSLEHFRPREARGSDKQVRSGSGAARAWLAKIAVHLARDRHRQRTRARVQPLKSQGPRTDLDKVPSIQERQTDGRPGPHQQSSHRELLLALESSLEELPFRLRAALVLRVFDRRSYEEIATLTGVTHATARTHVMRARRSLRQALKDWMEDAS